MAILEKINKCHISFTKNEEQKGCELLNKFGNLYYRAVSMIFKNNNGLIANTGPSKQLFNLEHYISKFNKYLQKYKS